MRILILFGLILLFGCQKTEFTRQAAITRDTTSVVETFELDYADSVNDINIGAYCYTWYQGQIYPEYNFNIAQRTDYYFSSYTFQMRVTANDTVYIQQDNSLPCKTILKFPGGIDSNFTEHVKIYGSHYQ